MENYRSKSCRDGREMHSERDSAVVPSGMTHDLPRSYSTNHAASSASSVHPPPPPPGYSSNNFMMGKEIQVKKMKNSQGSIAKSWSLSDPAELKRKKRVAGYKVYAVEGKVKGSFRKSFRWIKDIVYGWR